MNEVSEVNEVHEVNDMNALNETTEVNEVTLVNHLKEVTFSYQLCEPPGGYLKSFILPPRASRMLPQIRLPYTEISQKHCTLAFFAPIYSPPTGKKVQRKA